MLRTTAILIVAWIVLTAPSEGAFTITLNYQNIGAGGVNGSGISSSQAALIGDAAGTWESYIVGYQSGISLSGMTISVTGSSGDGSGGQVGSGVPTSFSVQAGFLLGTAGALEFDSDDLGSLEGSGLLESVALHELGHALGIGTLWDADNFVPGTQQVINPGAGQYTGASGLAAYQQEFDALASFVPVETFGGVGTADYHWDEVNFGAGLTGITDSQGRDLANEIMTGWIGSDPSQLFLSNTTIMSLEDIGYAVALTPEPGAAALSLLGLLLVVRQRRRELGIGN